MALMRLIDEEYTRRPFFGSRQMRNILGKRGYLVNRKRIRRLMKIMGLQSLAPKPGTSKPSPQHKIYPYLLRGLAVTGPNQVWSTDITYIRLKHGFVYLVAVIDVFSRKVLSWELSATMDVGFRISALERAIRLYGAPEIFNTDQGAQFTSNRFTEVLKRNRVKIGMDGKGRAFDNIFIERVWRSLKYEEIYLNEYKSAKELKTSLATYFSFYNVERPHQSLETRTPDETYFASFKKAA